MALYQLLSSAASVLRTTDGACVPTTDPRNADYQAYLAWVAAGNTPDPADPPTLRFQANLPLGAQLRTTDAAPAEIFRATLAPTTLYRARIVVLAVDAGNGAYATLERVVSVERLGGGAVNLLVTDVTIQRMTNAAAVTAGVSSWTLGIAASGADIVATVSGAAGRTVDWGMSGDLVRYTPSGFTP
jgi:hypothetical protein